MSDIRQLTESEIETFAWIGANAYPGFRPTSPEAFTQMRDRMAAQHTQEPTVAFYGLFRDGEMLGGMRLHDFQMNFLGVRMLVGGVGMVAVDLLHKKEHVAKEMIEYFLRHYRERGAALALLYPFRPDFYKQMGFGYGPAISQYRVRPAALPRGDSKAYVRRMRAADREAVAACYSRYTARTHGMIEKSKLELDRMMALLGPGDGVVYEKAGQVQGYLLYDFEKGPNFITNDMHVREFIYETPEALSELCTYLHTQADQIRRIIFETLDESFYFLLSDPRNTAETLIPSVYHEIAAQGMGLMYRVIHTAQLFRLLAAHDFGGQTCRLRLTLHDSFLPENADSVVVAFDAGRAQVLADGPADVELRLPIAEFSSLVAGAVPFERLWAYGLAQLSDPGYAPLLERLFHVAARPVCMTAF